MHAGLASRPGDLGWELGGGLIVASGVHREDTLIPCWYKPFKTCFSAEPFILLNCSLHIMLIYFL